jgi:5-hydroxyisourate hydrolase-like protein (transthyretin family)
MRRQKRNKTLVDAYQEFKDEFGDEKVLQDIDKTVYRNVCIRFNELMAEAVIVDAKEFKMPSGLGTIRIKKIISNQKRRVDWKATREHDTKIYHLNFHTDGYYYKWFWHKKKALFTNKSAYSFSPTRNNKRTLASLLKSNSVEFFE